MVTQVAASPQDSAPVAPDLVRKMLTEADLEIFFRALRRDWAKFACRSAGMPTTERHKAGRARLRLYIDAIDAALEAGAEDAERIMADARRRGW